MPSLCLKYQAPLAWGALLAFLALRCPMTVGRREGSAYVQAINLAGTAGWVRVDPVAGAALAVQYSSSLQAHVAALEARLRVLFDLDTDPRPIDAQLRFDALIGGDVLRTPGLRVPGSVDDFALVLRTLLGQQISVQRATVLYGQFAQRFGVAVAGPDGSRLHTPALASRVAQATVEEIGLIGMPRRRAATIHTLARLFATGELQLSRDADTPALRERLDAIPGIGDWTLQYLAMRGLRDADAFPAGDLGVKQALQVKTPGQAQRAAERWRPWRAYAVMHLWCRPHGA
ncbi:MAG TPA: AlkA N-terminal domain-containing protein [Nevskiaceae bacterium]|nr:AlkA N-terminal domain-containing protein [Nevskiaceae bacterium]